MIQRLLAHSSKANFGVGVTLEQRRYEDRPQLYNDVLPSNIYRMAVHQPLYKLIDFIRTSGEWEATLARHSNTHTFEGDQNIFILRLKLLLLAIIDEQNFEQFMDTLALGGACIIGDVVIDYFVRQSGLEPLNHHLELLVARDKLSILADFFTEIGYPPHGKFEDSSGVERAVWRKGGTKISGKLVDGDLDSPLVYLEDEPCTAYLAWIDGKGFRCSDSSSMFRRRIVWNQECQLTSAAEAKVATSLVVKRGFTWAWNSDHTPVYAPVSLDNGYSQNWIRNT